MEFTRYRGVTSINIINHAKQWSWDYWLMFISFCMLLFSALYFPYFSGFAWFIGGRGCVRGENDVGNQNDRLYSVFPVPESKPPPFILHAVSACCFG